ncbi:hypothetical protein AGMMS49940_15370 [Spirochaetia bacterium]|nr:hypothetical protein AGMMS49940_15370 [Spirochaetia bacterium]
MAQQILGKDGRPLDGWKPKPAQRPVEKPVEKPAEKTVEGKHENSVMAKK